MHAYQQDFLALAHAAGVLRFGSFTLKSGRQSPYFFNLGQIATGARLERLGAAYAACIEASGMGFDMLFGPAYKGIPLAAATSIALASLGANRPFCFNRKETKDHGEGGNTVGAPLKGRVLIIDDVISAGTSVRESVEIIKNAGAEPCCVAIALDRMERGLTEKSAAKEVESAHGIPVLSIASLDDLLAYLDGAEGMAENLRNVRNYRDQYGVDTHAR